MKLIKNYLLLLCLTALLFNCENETFKEKENISKIATIDINDAKLLLNKASKTSANNFIKDVDFNNISKENLSDTDVKLTVLNAKTTLENYTSRILFLKINNKTEGVVINTYANKNATDSLFSGEAILTKLNGDFFRGFRIENGFIIEDINLASNNNNAAKQAKTFDDGSECRMICGHYKTSTTCICNMQSLNEIVVQARSPRKYISITTIYGNDNGGDTNSCEYECDNNWNFGGSGGDTNSCEY